MFPRTGYTSAPSASSGCISAAFRGVQPWTVKFEVAKEETCSSDGIQAREGASSRQT